MSIDELISPSFTVAVAHQVLDHHANGGTCQRCTAADCDQTARALEQIAANHARRRRSSGPCWTSRTD
ncbi:MAG TPA: hypothetical protein VIQ30_18050 [Pseudonocardia sp.]